MRRRFLSTVMLVASFGAQMACQREETQAAYGEDYTPVAPAGSTGSVRSGVQPGGSGGGGGRTFVAISPITTPSTPDPGSAENSSSGNAAASSNSVASPLINAPAAATNSSNFAVEVASEDFVQYRYAIVYGEESCSSATMSAWIKGSTPIAVKDIGGEGPRKLCVIGRNVYGHETAVEYEWTKDTTPPTATVVDAADGVASAFAATVAGAGVTSYRYAHLVDAGDCAAASYSAWVEVVTTVTAAFATSGSQLLCVQGRDAAGNEQVGPTAYLKPHVALSGTPLAFSNDTVLDVSVSGVGVAEYRYSLLAGAASCDGATYSDWMAVENKITAATGIDGAKLLCVVGRSAAGATSYIVASHAWINDSSPPDVPTLSGTPSNPSKFTTLDVTVSGNDVSQYRFAVMTGAADCSAASYGVSTPIAVKITAATGVDGAKRLCVKSLDRADNEQSTSTQFAWTQDSTAPTATLTGAPAASTTTVDTAVSVTVGPAGDATEYKYALLSGTASCSGAAYPATWVAVGTAISTSLGADGLKTICVIARDALANEQQTATARTWTKDTTPPVTTLAGTPASLSNVTTLNVSITDTDTDQYKYAVTTGPNCIGATYGAFRSKATNITDLLGADGGYRLCVIGKDVVGNLQAVAAEYSWTKDTTPPNAAALTLTGTPTDPSNVTAVAVTVNGADIFKYKYKIGVDASTSCSSSTGYSATEYDRATETIASAVSGLADGSLELCVWGKDGADNFQALADARSFVWVKDTMAPTATLSGQPGDPSLVTTLNVDVNGTAASDVYRYKLGAEGSTDCSSATGYSGTTIAIGTNITDNISGQADQRFKICAVAIDLAGNIQPYSSATTYSWTKDTTPPTVTLGNLPASLANATTLNVSITDSTTDQYKHFITTAANCAAATYGAYRAKATNITDTLGADSAMRLCVIGKDALGNEQTTATEYAWTKDTTPPTAAALTLAGTPADPTNVTTLGVTVNGADVAKYKYKVGADGSTTCSSSTGYSATEYDRATETITASVSGIGDGSVELCVWGRDAAGNYQVLADTRSFVWVKDTVRPTAAISGQPADPSSAVALNIDVSADGASDTYRHKVGEESTIDCANATGYSGATSVATNITDGLTGYADGRVKLCVVAKDPAGNEQLLSSATTYAWTKDNNSPAPGSSGTITPSGVDLTSLTLTWTKATDLVTAQASLQYKVYRSATNNIDTIGNMDACESALSCTVMNGGFTTNIGTYAVTGLSSNTQYYFNVRVKDGVGREAVYTMLSQRTPQAIHLAYADVTNGRVKSAKTATSVTSFTVETAETVATPEAIALAIDANKKANISYRSGNDLRYLTNKSGSWVAVLVDAGFAQSNTDIQIASNGYVHVTFYRFDSNKDWKHTYHDGTSWLATANKIWNGNGSAVKGFYAAMVLDSNDKVHAVGHDSTNKDLIYNTDAGGSWANANMTIVDNGANPPIVGEFSSVARDASNNIYAAYYDLTNGDLKYAKKTSGTWGAAETRESANNVGQYTGIAITPDNRIHIVFYDVTNGDLRYVCHNGTSWQAGVVVDGAGIDAGKYASIVGGLDNNVHVAYYDATNLNLKYGKGSCGGSWVLSTVDSTGDVGTWTDIALDR